MIEAAQAKIAGRMTDRIKNFIRQTELEAERGRKALEFRRTEMAGRHREQRNVQKQAQERRWTAETNARAARLKHGFSGVWTCRGLMPPL